MRKVIAASALVIAISLLAGSGFANEKYRWYIIRGKDKICRVIEADGKTPATIAGPFKTRENALAAKEERCQGKRRGAKKKSTTKKKDPIGSELDRALSETRKDLRKKLK
jgi:hypothetical protein